VVHAHSRVVPQQKLAKILPTNKKFLYVRFAACASAEATAAQATAAMEKVQVHQLTQVQKKASPEVPLDPLAKEVQPESSAATAEEKAPATTIDTATLIATLRTMQHGVEQTMQDALSSIIHGRACNTGTTHGLRQGGRTCVEARNHAARASNGALSVGFSLHIAHRLWGNSYASSEARV
jgi:hypothetical protein